MKKIGHRGACGYEPENTLKSFKKAIDLGVDMAECDVWLTKDKKIVVIHDEAVDRTTNGHGQVSNLTLKDIKTLDAGKGEKIPTLIELLNFFKNYQVKLNIEVKTKNVAEYLVEELKKTDFPLDNLFIFSMYLETIAFVKNKITRLNTAWVFKPLEKPWQQFILGLIMKMVLPIVHNYLIKNLLKYQIKTLNLYFPLIKKKFIEKLHNKNVNINVWTVNDPGDIARMKKLGIDGIFSNFPDRL